MARTVGLELCNFQQKETEPLSDVNANLEHLYFNDWNWKLTSTALWVGIRTATPCVSIIGGSVGGTSCSKQCIYRRLDFENGITFVLTFRETMSTKISNTPISHCDLTSLHIVYLLTAERKHGLSLCPQSIFMVKIIVKSISQTFLGLGRCFPKAQ